MKTTTSIGILALTVFAAFTFFGCTKSKRDSRLARLRQFRGRMPASFRFDRDEIHERDIVASSG